MWNARSRIPRVEKKDGSAGGEDRVHAPLQGIPVGRKQDARPIHRAGIRTDCLGQCCVRVIHGYVHLEYRRPVQHAALETALNPLQHPDPAARAEEQFTGDPPGKPPGTCGKVPRHLIGVM